MNQNINKEPVVVSNLLSDDELSKIYMAIGTIFGINGIESYNSLVNAMEDLAKSDFSEYLKKIRASSRSIFIRNVLSIDKLIFLAEKFSITKPVEFSSPVLHVSSSALQPHSKGVSPHQDWPSTLGSLNSVNIWISLGGSTKNSGGLDFYCFDEHPVEVLPGTIEKDVVSLSPLQLEKYKKIYVYVSPGDAIIFGNFLPHSSSESSTRLSVSLRIEDAADDSWRARGYEYAQTTKIDRKVFSANELNKINDQLKKN
ncbi:hypothetical protein N8804_01090 [Methylophilaceae bacterium]|nr:hypothetical protein [Methylophilaceae bacterium]